MSNNLRDCIYDEKDARDKLERDQEDDFAALVTQHGVVKAWWDAGQPLPPALEKHLRAHKLVCSGAVHDGSLATVPASVRLRIAKFLCSTVRFVTDPSSSSAQNPRVASAELIIKETVALDDLDGSGIAAGIQVFVNSRQMPINGAHFFVASIPRTLFARESIRHLLVLPNYPVVGHRRPSTHVELQLDGDGAALCHSAVQPGGNSDNLNEAWWSRLGIRTWDGIRVEDLAERR